MTGAYTVLSAVNYFILKRENKLFFWLFFIFLLQKDIPVKHLNKLSLKAVRVFILVALFSSLFSNAVFAKFGRHSRIEIGYSYVMASGVYQGTGSIYDMNNNYIHDTSVKINVKATLGFGYSAGVNFPLTRLGNNSTLSLYVGLIYNFYIWGSLSPVFNTDGSQNTSSPFADNLAGWTAKIGTPIGLDVKIGTDALCKRRPHFGATFGAGVLPNYNETAMAYSGSASTFGDISAGVNYGINPYVKGEVSFFLGICFKLKAMYSFGDVPLIDHTKNIISSDSPFKMTEKSCITMSLTVEPFSFLWKKTKWFNDYDTEKPYR